MRKLIHGSAITGRERGVVAAYSGFLKEAKWTSLVNGSNPTHTGVQRQIPRTGLFDIATRFPRDDTAGTRNYVTLPKYHDWRTGGTIAITMRSMALGGAANRYISSAFGSAAGNTWYQMYLGPTNVLWTYFNAATNTGYTMPLYKWVRLVLTWTSTAFWVYVDGNQQATVAGLVLPSDISAATNMLGQADGANNLAEWDVADFQQFSTTMTADEVKQDYLRYSRRIQWQEDLVTARVSPAAEGGTVGALLSNTQIRFGDGTVRAKISDATINGKACKAVECTVAGPLYIPAQYLGFETASPELGYGTFSWMYYKGAFNSRAHFISSGSVAANGYAIVIPNNGELDLARYTGGAAAAWPMTSAAGTISNGVWTKITVARRYDGRFSIYKNNVLVPAATGANPCTDATHTNSSYVVFDMGVGDFLAMLDKQFGEVL